MNKQMDQCRTKRHSFIIIIIYSLIAFISHEALANENQVVVTGRVIGYAEGSVDLYIIYTQPGRSRKQEEIPVENDGLFEYRLESSTSLDAKILDKKTFANIDFIYHPGDSIHVEFSPEKESLELLKTVVFSGDGQKTNNQIIGFQLQREEMNLGFGAIKPTESYQKEVIDFVNHMTLLKKKQLDLLDRYELTNQLTDEALKWIEWFALETYYYFLDDYGFERQDLPGNYYDYNDRVLTLDATDMVCWYILKDRINSYWMNSVKPHIVSSLTEDELGRIQNGNMDSDSLVIRFLDDNVANDLLSQLLIANYFNTNFKARMIDGYEKHKPELESIITFPFIWNGIDKHYLEAYQFINKPNEFTYEVLKKIEDTPIEETMNKIIADNKGKVIYIDCWATWCSPCIQAMPDSKKLMSKFDGKDIVFVYICIESNEKLWKRFVSEFKLGGGQHYLMDKEQSKFFRNAMNVQGVPEYFLIDKTGNIVDRGHHLHPRELTTEKRILELL